MLLIKSKPALQISFASVNKVGLSTLSKSLLSTYPAAISPSPVKPFIKKIVIKDLLKKRTKTYPSFKKNISINELSEFEISVTIFNTIGIKTVTSSAAFDGFSKTCLLPPTTVIGKADNNGHFKTSMAITRSFNTPVKLIYYSKIRFIITLENTSGITTEQVIEIDIN